MLVELESITTGSERHSPSGPGQRWKGFWLPTISDLDPEFSGVAVTSLRRATEYDVALLCHIVRVRCDFHTVERNAKPRVEKIPIVKLKKRVDLLEPTGLARVG